MSKNDIGHLKLLDDITSLLKDASDYQYHDFKNSLYAAPKLALVQKLDWLLKNTKEGKYDNKQLQKCRFE